GGDGDGGRARRAGDGDTDGGRLHAGAGQEIEPRIDRVDIVESDDAATEGKAAAAQGEVAAPERQATDDGGSGGRAADLQAPGHLGIEAATAHEDGLRRIDRE